MADDDEEQMVNIEYFFDYAQGILRENDRSKAAPALSASPIKKSRS